MPVAKERMPYIVSESATSEAVLSQRVDEDERDKALLIQLVSLDSQAK